MFKLGVCRSEQYRQSGLGRWLRNNRISYQLLRTPIPPTSADVTLFESITRTILMPGGVYRTTRPNRFQALNRFLNQVLEEHFGRVALDIHDWAASDCSTSAAWYQALAPVFPGVTLTASDQDLHLTEASLPDGETYIFDRNGEPLQYIRPPFVIRFRPPEPRLLIVNRLLLRSAHKKLVRLRQCGELMVDGSELDGRGEVSRPPYVFRRIPLVHPVAAQLVRSEPSFRIERHSVFEPLGKPSNVIRTMNILNRAYFDTDRLTMAARTVWTSLMSSGVWIVGRTIEDDPPVHHASVLVRVRNGFAVLQRHGEKSEIEDLALAMRPEV